MKHKNNLYYIQQTLKLFSVSIFTILLIFIVADKSTGNSNGFIPESDILQQSLKIIETNYFDPRLFEPKVMFKRSLEEIEKEIAPVLVNSKNTNDVIINVANESINVSLKNINSINDLENELQQAIKYIKQNISLTDFPDFSIIDQAAINGVLATLDPHSQFFTPEIYSNFSSEAQGEYAGVGMVIQEKDGKIAVIAIIGKDSPAKKSNVQAGDLIIQINNFSTEGMSLEDAKNKLRGKKSSRVDILVEREDVEKPIKITLIRDEIKLPSVNSYEFKEENLRYGYVRINKVIANTSSSLREHLIDLGVELKDFGGLIIDLRNNPGGLLDQAIEISNMFLERGVIVSIAGAGKKNVKNHAATSYGTVKQFPIIVLVNKYSASAAEIIAGALQQNKRAIVIGETTFGKGTVQSLIGHFKDGSALKLTTSQYLTPGELSIQSIGIVPELFLHPFEISEKNIVISSLNSRSESGLENSYKFSDRVAEDSLYTLNYLQPEKKENQEEIELLLDYGEINSEALINDYMVSSGLSILKNTIHSNYKNLINAIEKYLDEEKFIQANNIQTEFKKISIDWSDQLIKKHEVLENKFIDLDIQIEEETEENSDKYKLNISHFPTNKNGRLAITATNNTNSNLTRLWAEIESNKAIFNNKQIAFGNINPGKSKTWYLPFKTDNFIGSNLAELEFNFSQDYIELPQKEFRIVSFEVSETPYLDFQFKVETGNPLKTYIDNDIILSELILENISNIDSGPLSISIKNADFETLSISRGQISIANILAGEKTIEPIELKVIGIPKDDMFDLLFSVIPRQYPLDSFEQKIKLDVNSSNYSIENSSPRIDINDPNITMSDDSFQFNADIFDNSGIKDIYIFDESNKIFYARASNNQTMYNIKLNVQLKENDYTNLILVASDIYDVRSTKQLFLPRLNY